MSSFVEAWVESICSSTMIHNLPRFLRGEDRADFEAEFVKLFVADAVARYPDMSTLVQELPLRARETRT